MQFKNKRKKGKVTIQNIFVLLRMYRKTLLKI